jgi:hypothetical protein
MVLQLQDQLSEVYQKWIELQERKFDIYYCQNSDEKQISKQNFLSHVDIDVYDEYTILMQKEDFTVENLMGNKLFQIVLLLSFF